MALYEVISGNIAAGSKYQVTGGISIIYNGVTVNTEGFFIGVTGVTDYYKTNGSEIVTHASGVLGVAIGIENDFYKGKFNDESKICGISLELGARPYKSQIIRTTYKE
jgi:hypothetical protein